MVDFLLYRFHGLLLESISLGLVEVQGDEVRRLVELVHKVAERFVSCLLEVHVVTKADGNARVDESFESQQLLDHLYRILLQLFGLDNF